MDQAKEKLKILLIHRPPVDGAEGIWARFAKAVGSFTDLQLVESDSFLQGDVGEHKLASFQHIFLDYTLADWDFLSKFNDTPLALVAKEAFSLEKNGARELLGDKIQGRTCLNISGLPASDLARLMHLYLIPKRVAGVLPLLEKGALVLGEKIQSSEGIGTAIDKLATYLDQMESFELKARIPDLRQVLSAVLLESYRLAKETDTPYPTVDFQVGVSAKKLVVNLRFRNSGLGLTELSVKALNGLDFFWQQAWLCADISFFTEHVMHKELEAMFVLHKPQREPANVFHSLILKSLKQSGKRENLLAKPQDYTFQFLSDVRLKQHDVTNILSSAADDVSSDLDLGTLPEPVVAKLKGLAEAQNFTQEQLAKKETELREIAAKLSAIDLELQQKKGEVLRLGKASQVQSETAVKRIKDLERRILNLQTQQKADRESVKETKPESAGVESIHKLEANIRVLEGEKAQMLEKFTSEQKRYGALEAKYSLLFKDLSGKDKDINELKAVTLKLKKENEKLEGAAATKSAAAAGSGPDAAKLKELEMREQALKQELKKMLFKVENNEKNVKAIQNESAEKAKLLEQKLGAAKAKELELLKKIDELAGLVKKVNKAA
jgi:hypothetical protein